MLVITVDTTNSEKRLDNYVAQTQDLTRSESKLLIKSGQVSVNGKIIFKPAFNVKSGFEIKISKTIKENICEKISYDNLSIIYKDEHILVIEKPSGLTVHHGIKHRSNTLADKLVVAFPEINKIGERGRNGIVHRLDKDTSGLMIIALESSAYNKLQKMFKRREILKYYVALVFGKLLEKKGIIDAPIGRNPKNPVKQALINTGKESITNYIVIQEFDDVSLVEIHPETGRMHQIRVHFSGIGHPIIGDIKYGNGYMNSVISRQFLHAHKIKFHHPITGKTMVLKSPLPSELTKVVDCLQ